MCRCTVMLLMQCNWLSQQQNGILRVSSYHTKQYFGCSRFPFLINSQTTTLNRHDCQLTSGITKSPYIYFHDKCTSETKYNIAQCFSVAEDFVTADEEEMLLKEVEPHLKRLKYEFNHWDDAIHGYRETEVSRWTKAATVILTRVHNESFPSCSKQLPQTHVLDLEKSGIIKPHIDSIRFCGNIITGVSLLSSSVMRLVHNDHKKQVVDVLLKRRDEVRYKYTHEILGESQSYFGETSVPRDRRISIICRNHPIYDDMNR